MREGKIKYLGITLSGFLGIAFLVVLFLSLKPIKIGTLISNPRPSQSYQESIIRIQELQKHAPKELASTGHLILMDHGQKVEKAIVFFHGFTSSPRQFKDLGERFYQRGYNVYIPRIPHHGMNDQRRSHLDELTAEKLVQTCDEAVDIAQGLGDHVTVVGLSMGGVMAGWTAQFRSDVNLAVIIAPNFGTYRIPNFLLKQTINLLYTIPDHFIWWDPKQKSRLKRPTGTYHGFSSQAMAEIRRLGWSVQTLGKNLKPKARSMLVITNENDNAVNNENIGLIINNWIAHDYQVQTYAFPKELKLGHDLIDPEQTNQQVSVVYPKMIGLIAIKEAAKKDYLRTWLKP